MNKKNGSILARPLLEIENVTVIRGDENKKVLDSISLVIREGENVAILGPNGSGKSSLIKTITREYYPARAKGTLRIWGRDRWNVSELRVWLGVVSNELQFTCTRDYSGMEMVLSGFFSSIGVTRSVTVSMRRKALQVLRFLDIEPLKGRKVSVMSSGEARRFLIARALVHDPKTLLLDEPTNSLDLKAAHHFKEMLRKIARSGIGIILVTQTLEDIIPEIQRMILMKNSRIVQDGPKNEIMTAQHISRLFELPVEMQKKDGYYHAR
jgi:iron complex transport system ATP-binding protein